MDLPCPHDICDGSGIIPDDGTDGSTERKCLCAIDDDEPETDY
jgi:hypothetical protein